MKTSLKLALAFGLVAVLAFPSDGSALLGHRVIGLTPTGPSPVVATMTAGSLLPWWINQDKVTHTVVFANGLCSLQLAPGQEAYCSNSFWAYVGHYPYAVDGTTQASVVVTPSPRTVTLTARSHLIARGGSLRLHGVLEFGSVGGNPPVQYSDVPVIVFARHGRHDAFRRIAMAAEPGRRQSSGFLWELWLHPKTTTIYVAEVTNQPDFGQVWQNARSNPFKVIVRR